MLSVFHRQASVFGDRFQLVRLLRACVVNANIQPGENVLITGIGGGVAITCLQLCVAHGARVWVTSGSAEKIAKAVEYGAQGGVSYKSGMSILPDSALTHAVKICNAHIAALLLLLF
jgi:NADPH:quinone reductase-like Zn-dependent oxidoreductase